MIRTAAPLEKKSGGNRHGSHRLSFMGRLLPVPPAALFMENIGYSQYQSDRSDAATFRQDLSEMVFLKMVSGAHR